MKKKIVSLLVMLTLIVGMMPLSGIASFAGGLIIESGTYSVQGIYMESAASLAIAGGTFEKTLQVGLNYNYSKEFTGSFT